MIIERLSVLTLKEIRDCIRQFTFLPRRIENKRVEVINFIQNLTNFSMLSSLERSVLVKEKEKEGRQADGLLKRKRKVDDQRERRVKRRPEEDKNIDFGRYLELPSKDDVARCYRQFYESSGTEATSSVVCGVCSREVNVSKDKVISLLMSDIPNSHRLIPFHKHPAHDIFDDMLLEPKGVHDNKVNVCGECLRELGKDIDTPPRLSLANNLWIRKVPWELERLTLPEQLLIAHLYPRVYVFKLYPKTFICQTDGSTLQRGMRRNVSTYTLDMDGVTSMIKGNLMPRLPSILASIISVTFIGVGSLPSEGIHHIFRVRRQAVFKALQWLKKNNPEYYCDVCVDVDQLNNLPDDGVPPEILAIMQELSDVSILDHEAGGYVRVDDEVDGGE
jgi:hypothetical protein